MATRQDEKLATPVVAWRIQQPEDDARVERVRRELERRQFDGLVLLHPIRMAYLSGFSHLSTERLMAIVVGLEGGLGALIPHPEKAHIGKAPGSDRVTTYPKFPRGGTKHPLLHLADLLAEMR